MINRIHHYDAFVRNKTARSESMGFEPLACNAALFEWQSEIVRWAVRRGRAALFEECGLGKTLQQLEWSRQVVDHTDGCVLILTPLAVSQQTVEESAKFGIDAKICRQPEDVPDRGIGVINYERLHLMEDVLPRLAGVVLDESSILKSFTGKMKGELIAAFKNTPYRLACTATPSPNDLMELGNHAEFLGLMSSQQMLATWFINDTANTGDWRLKKHAAADFWRWVASWAACVSSPRDLGHECAGFDLPEMIFKKTMVDAPMAKPADDELFSVATALSATEVRTVKKQSLMQRCQEAVRIATETDEPVLIWCDLNDEADALVDLLPAKETVEVRGRDKAEHKERKLLMFTHGERRIMVTKPSIAGYGLNWQHCRKIIFVGLTYSFEDFYQAVRRCHRFGQTRQVEVTAIVTEADEPVYATLKRKMDQHETMHSEMRKHAADFLTRERDTFMKTTIDQTSDSLWTVYHGDCVRAAKEIEDESVGLSVFSPPFADLFTYSNDEQDMGNCRDLEEFMHHFRFLVEEIKRVMMPGREVCVHCCDLLATKWKDGAVELKDFPGQLVSAFREAGFLFHSRITIWKSPVTEMQRTKAHGLLYKTLQSDSANSRVGAPDYLLVFRKPGKNPQPITKDPATFPLDLWQEVASPVWMTIDQGNVLNGNGARDQGDERHICPLQLDVIERAVALWSNPMDVVYSPFTGIGSELYTALKMGRRAVGSELKQSYYDQAVANLRSVTNQRRLF